MSDGYLGDNGPSFTSEFSFVLPGSSTFYMVFQQIFPGNTGLGCSFRFRVDFGFCNQAAETTLIVPDDVRRGPNTDEPEEGGLLQDSPSAQFLQELSKLDDTGP